MGEQDGSSSAVRGAQSEEDEQSTDNNGRSSGFFSRVMGALSPSENETGEGETPAPSERSTTHGMINLRRMRVDDVAIPQGGDRGGISHQFIG